MASIAIVDCFDSFTYNIFHYLDRLNNGEVKVIRYNELGTFSFENYSHIVFSPGPGLPKDYPLIDEILEKFQGRKNILGICLGMQHIAVHAGAKLTKLNSVKHGISSVLEIYKPSVLFNGIEKDVEIGHYHSWVVSEDNFPKDVFSVSSKDLDGNIMSIEAPGISTYGVQFHPESVLTSNGLKIFENWLADAK